MESSNRNALVPSRGLARMYLERERKIRSAGRGKIGNRRKGNGAKV